MFVRAIVTWGLLATAASGQVVAQDTIVDLSTRPTATAPGAATAPAPAAARRPSAPAVRQAPARDTAATVPAPGASLDVRSARREADSLLRVIATMRQKVPADPASRRRFEDSVNTAWVFMAAWLVLVVLYLAWAIHLYVYNYGLSNREWKVLYPEIYENAFDRLVTRVTGSSSFSERREALLSYRQRAQQLLPAITGGAADAAPGDAPATDAAGAPDNRLLDEPTKNPYQADSFGLPPGTIRGILALTALFMFLLMEGVNLHSPGSLEGQFDGLVTALQMVLAFYFGSRAVEVLQAKTTARAAESSGSSAAAPAAPPEPPAAGDSSMLPPPPAPAPGALPAPSADKSFLPESSTSARFDQVIVMSKNEPPAPPQAALSQATPLSKRVLALTAGFETGRGFPDCFGGLTGNFDKQGISFGALQWNIGQGSLQPLWREMHDKHPAELKAVLGNLHDDFSRMLDLPQLEQMRWALEIQHLVSGSANTWKIADTWKDALQRLGKSAEMIEIQVRTANTLYQVALSFCADYGLTRERGAALMFDLRVQNGTVDKFGSGDRMRADFARINPSLSEDDRQLQRMRIVARRRADVSRPEFRTDVFKRKIAIAEGKGIVHGRPFDLERDFAIGMGQIK